MKKMLFPLEFQGKRGIITRLITLNKQRSISKMKKTAMVLAAMLAAVTVIPSLSAAEAVKNDQTKYADSAKRSAFQIGFFPGIPNSTQEYNVYGLKLGLPMVDGLHWVYGQELSILYSGTFYIKGCQITLAGPALTVRTEGLQLTPGPAITRDLYGLQIGTASIIVGDATGCQIGVASIANKFIGCQIGAANVAYNEIDGWQVGAVNVIDELFAGCQMGAINVATARCKGGIQVGAINVATHNGIQFGVINIMPDSVIPVTIIFNYAPDRSQKEKTSQQPQAEK